MARKTIDITISDENSRDYGKTFRITEMSAADAEIWGMKALHAMVSSGIEVPQEYKENPSLAVMASIGIKALGQVQFDLLKPLLDQMMSCVEYIPDVTKPTVTNKLIDLVVEEVSTRLKLRYEVLLLHIGFFMNAGLQATE